MRVKKGIIFLYHPDFKGDSDGMIKSEYNIYTYVGKKAEGAKFRALLPASHMHINFIHTSQLKADGRPTSVALKRSLFFIPRIFFFMTM